MTNHYLLRSGHKEFFPYWDQEDAVSIGWRPESEKVLDDASWDKTRQRIDDNYPTESPGNATGEAFCFAGREGKGRPPMSEDDIVIIVGKRDIKGEAVLRAVAKVGEVDKREDPINEDYQYSVYRDVNDWLYNDGPVARKELNGPFQRGEMGSTWFRGTLKQWKPDRENDNNVESLLERLIEELNNAPKIQPKQYDFEYDERVVQEHISDHPKEFSIGTGVKHNGLMRESITEGKKRADFLTVIGEENATVIETKIDTAGASAVRQIKGYMQDLADDFEGGIQGILVAEDFVAFEDIKDEIGDYDIELKRYSVTLEYDDVKLE